MIQRFTVTELPKCTYVLVFTMNTYWCRIIVYLAVCLMTGPKPLPKPALHIVRFRASSFRCEYPHHSISSSCSFLHHLPLLPVASIPPFIFPSITCHRRQVLCKMWPIRLAFHLLMMYDMLYIFNCSWVDTWWQQYITHLQTNSTHNTEKGKIGRFGLCPVFANYTLAFALQLGKKHGKTSVRVEPYKYKMLSIK
jgi:hypothetical protein